MNYLRHTVYTLIFLLSGMAAGQPMVAVLDFKNNGDASLGYLESGVANMLVTTLANSTEIQIVERGQLKQVLEEVKLGMTGVVDPETAAEIGKIAGAQFVVIGSVTQLGEALRLDAKVVQVETGVVLPGAVASARAGKVEYLDVAVDGLAKSLLTNLTGEDIHTQRRANPNLPGRLEFTFPAQDEYQLFVDGKKLEATVGRKGMIELSHGKHDIKMIRALGMFEEKTVFDARIDIPGGQIVRARMNNNSLDIYETVATPTSTLVGDMRPSNIVVFSGEGMCKVFLDGEEKINLPVAELDQMISATIFDVAPGSYTIKIEGFDTWYQGSLNVGPGEEIKIQTDPGEFKIMSRKPLAY